MAKNTKIQWADDTTNPIMGCLGCELFPKPVKVTNAIDRKLQEAGYKWPSGKAYELLEVIIDLAWKALSDEQRDPEFGLLPGVTTSSIYHARDVVGQEVAKLLDEDAAKLVVETIERQLTCYAAILHLNRGRNLFSPERQMINGYAPMFESPTQFAGRLKKAACSKSLVCQERPGKPWLNDLPRLIFVSDMGDAFSHQDDFDFLRKEVEWIASSKGRRHLWLWLTKRPKAMASFAKQLGGFPENVCAMTTVTSARSLHRIDKLRQVDSSMRGLSVEPLWESIADKIDLSGIDWVIVGGESDRKRKSEPFALEWAIELRDRCEEQGVAFFVKQLGSRPTQAGQPLELKDSHGGDWSEWPEELRIREMPKCFRDYRSTSAAWSQGAKQLVAMDSGWA